jgi:uncharacterized protein YraI
MTNQGKFVRQTKERKMNTLQSRREFCIKAVKTSAAAYFAMNSTATANTTKSAYSVPGHLPPKLAICSSQWA